MPIHHQVEPNPDTSTPDPHQDVFSKTVLGFWIYLMTDCILFATLFATYAVLHHSTFGGPALRRKYSKTVHCSHAVEAFIAMLAKRVPNGPLSSSGSRSREVEEPTMMESNRPLRMTCG